jgi:hypothetical protein
MIHMQLYLGKFRLDRVTKLFVLLLHIKNVHSDLKCLKFADENE